MIGSKVSKTAEEEDPDLLFLAQKHRFSNSIWTNFIYAKSRNQSKDSCTISEHETTVLKLIGDLWYLSPYFLPLGTAPCDQEETPSSQILPGEEIKD